MCKCERWSRDGFWQLVVHLPSRRRTLVMLVYSISCIVLLWRYVLIHVRAIATESKARAIIAVAVWTKTRIDLQSAPMIYYVTKNRYICGTVKKSAEGMMYEYNFNTLFAVENLIEMRSGRIEKMFHKWTLWSRLLLRLTGPGNELGSQSCIK